MVRIAITGINGRMGTMVSDIVLTQPDMELVAGFDLNGGKKVGNITVSSAADIDKVLKEVKPDVLIDFTMPAAALQNVKAAAANGVNLIVGTTGFDESQKKELESAIKAGNVRAIITPNFSVGVQVFFKVIGAGGEGSGRLRHRDHRGAPQQEEGRPQRHRAEGRGRHARRPGV